MSVPNPQQEPGPDLVQPLLQDPSGRATVEVLAVNPDSGAQVRMCLFDVDVNDYIDIMFQIEGGEPEGYTFALTTDTHRKNVMNRADRQRRREKFEELTERLMDEFADHELKAEDYYEDASIHFTDLPPQERVKVMLQDLEELRYEYERISYAISPKPGLLSRLFKRS